LSNNHPEIADSLSVSKGTVDTILHEHLQYSKVCAQWVPKHLTEDQKCLGSSPSPPLQPRPVALRFPCVRALKGRRFTDNDEVRETVEEWFRTQPKTFFADGIHRLVDQWDTCFNQQGDYV
jgi:hypothetical protein